jgi:hypothetical protein
MLPIVKKNWLLTTFGIYSAASYYLLTAFITSYDGPPWSGFSVYSLSRALCGDWRRIIFGSRENVIASEVCSVSLVYLFHWLGSTSDWLLILLLGGVQAKRMKLPVELRSWRRSYRNCRLHSARRPLMPENERRSAMPSRRPKPKLKAVNIVSVPSRS